MTPKPRPPHPAEYDTPPLPIDELISSGPNNACIRRLQHLELTPAPKLYPSTKPPGIYGEEIDIQTNVFGIEVHKKVDLFQYMIHIKTVLTSGKHVVFTKSDKKDFYVTDRHRKCCTILFHAFDQHDDFFNFKEKMFIFDGRNMLFSTHNLFQNLVEGEKKTMLFEINGAETGQKDLETFESITLEVNATTIAPIIFSGDQIGRCSADPNLESVQPEYRQILEMAISQQCIRDHSRCVIFEHGKIVFLEPIEEGSRVQNDCVDVGEGAEIKVGIKMDIQFIEGPYGRGNNNPSVVIDGIKIAFHKKQSMIEKMNEMNIGDFINGMSNVERERCNPIIKNLNCYTKYTGRKRHLTIEGIHHEGAATTRFRLKNSDDTCTVADYFKNRWSITLQYPNANLIVCKERGVSNFFPMELVFISPNQRVMSSQETSIQKQKIIEESTVLPNIRQSLIMSGKESANITTDNKILNDLGVSVCTEPLLVKGRQFPPVKLSINSSGPSISIKDNKWNINHYSRPATPPKDWAMLVVGTELTRFSPESVIQFENSFIEMCKSKGLILPPPAEVSLVNDKQIEQKLGLVAKVGCQFVLVITDDSITNLHQTYKRIENQRTMIIQDMRISTALSVIKQENKTILENIVNKTNVKLGGTNYLITDSNGYLNDVLVIGVGISSPPSGVTKEGNGLVNPIDIIGFAFNGKEKQEFTGDFLVAPAGQDAIAPIEDIMKKAITGYQKWHNGQTPKRIIVYRSGQSDRNHGSIISYEIPLARSVIRRFDPKIQLIYFEVSKYHAYRFFKTDLNHSGNKASGSSDACDMNIGSGVSIDNGVTHPACKQFFLNSHVTLQGSAKTPLYSILADDTDAPMDWLEDLTYHFSHLHQIVGHATSLPTPLYVANEYAKRGRHLWNEANAIDPAVRGNQSERVRLQDLTNAINY